MDKRKPDRNGLLEALFNVDNREESLADLLFPPSKKPRGRKRPWAKNLEECRHCGSQMPAGGACPGCGLMDEEAGR